MLTRASKSFDNGLPCYEKWCTHNLGMKKEKVGIEVEREER
jgi:hypothetical protein